MSAPKTTETLRIDYCRDPVGALSRWLWAAHEGKPHNFDRAEVRLDLETECKVVDWLAKHRPASGRVLGFLPGEPVCSFGNLFGEHGQLVDLSLYSNQDIDDELSLDFEGLAERVDSGERGTLDQLIAARVIVEQEDGDYLVACPSYPIDEFLTDYMPTMQERILELVKGEECTYRYEYWEGLDHDRIAAPAQRFKQAALELVPMIDDGFTKSFENFKVLLPWDRSELVQAMKEMAE